MKRTIHYTCVMLLALLCSCNHTPQKSALEQECDQLLQKTEELSYDITALSRNFSDEKYNEVMHKIDELRLTTPIDQVPDSLRLLYKRTQLFMDSITTEMRAELNRCSGEQRYEWTMMNDELVGAPGTEVPMYLLKGDTLYINFSTTQKMTATLYNMDSKSVVKKYGAMNKIDDKVAISNTAIYSLMLRSEQTQYVSVSIGKKSTSYENLKTSIRVRVDTIDAVASDFMAIKYQTINIQKVFEEPRKMSLRSAFKAAFSGSSRSIVALQLPAGANDVAYQLRISTSKSGSSSDGQFYDKSYEAYKQVKFLGLPVYESNKTNNSLLREILNRVAPPRKEEDAYCDMYVLNSESQAKKFQDGAMVEKLSYDINNSMVGTQSCNNRIPTKGKRTVYLGFLNGHTTTDVYIWLEAFATVPTTAYRKVRYTAVAR